jgi:5-carboxymethyl-2-hydroxymuconate isomerase
MPHMRIEYSPGLVRHVDIAQLCRAVHRAMIETGVFPLAGIRVRAFCADHCIVADDHPENEFTSCILAVGAGRPTEVLQHAGQHIFAALQECLAEPLAGPHFALSLEIRVTDPDLSWKDTPIHSRLTRKD